MNSNRLSSEKLVIRNLPQLYDYNTTFSAMKAFTLNRTSQTEDEIWLLEHHPVYTQGLAGSPHHLLQTTSTPIVQSDRGGQITYHGPGQLMLYALIDLKRKKLSVRDLVHHLEQSVIELLKSYAIKSCAQSNAPGVYVGKKKICSIGLKVKRRCSYHGIALNVKMDLTPFSFINPCGFKNLEMTQIADLLPTVDMETIKKRIISHFMTQFGYNSRLIVEKLP